MKIHYIIIAAALLIAGCKQNATEQATSEAMEPELEIIDESVNAAEPEAEPADIGESYFDHKAKTATKQAAAQPQQTAKPAAATKTAAATKRTNDKAVAETIYVETDDSRGRVWGHVTMKGDRGTGTVHDEGENTWAVTVTRHGNELFAVDQNSRQYVFKLKQNKTQE